MYNAVVWWFKTTDGKEVEGMTNTKKLEQAIDRSGLKKGKIAECLGVSHATLINLINGRTEFKVSQMQVLCAMLGLTPEERDAIFFGQRGGLNTPPGTDDRGCIS